MSESRDSKELLERFRPLYVIGRGGMGTVDLAIESGPGEPRVVALKRMLPGVRDRRHVDMFVREARLASLLHHKNVVHAIAYGEHDGEFLFAMEYVEGETLAGLLEKGERVPAYVAAYVLAELCEGLHAAHELKDVGGMRLSVVHRDVSPHNVMLTYEGDVKLLDFGVAKLDSAVHLTKTGEVKGKTAYMSPEQAAGDELDRRSDLYGVGALLFELVSGRRMWSGETDLEFLRQLALASPPSLADAAPGAPAELVELQRRLVAKNPAERPANAQEVATLLRAVAATAPEAPKRTLARIMSEDYGDTARRKRLRLAEALSAIAHGQPVASEDGSEPSNGEPLAVIAPATAQRPSRASPWIYGGLGAAVATAIVLMVAKGGRSDTQQPSISPSTSAPAASVTAIVAASSDPTVPVVMPAAAPTRSPIRSRPPSNRPRIDAPAASSAPRTRPVIDVDPNPI